MALMALAVATQLGCGCVSLSWAGDDESAALDTGIDVYVYAYPLVLMDVNRRYVQKAGRVNNNQFIHGRTFADASSTAVVAPNNDFLNSVAWLDLSLEPVILHVPDFGSRYYLAPLMDAWSNVFASPGTRTTGNGVRDFAVVGPRWKGVLPSGMTVINSPTNMVWILLRIHSIGTSEDIAAVHALQDLMTLTPLSSYGKSYTPPPFRDDPTTSMLSLPPEQVTTMDAKTFFTCFANLLKSNPPAASDAPMIAKLGSAGIIPGGNFDFNKLDPVMWTGLSQSVIPAQIKIRSSRSSRVVNRWNINLDMGSYGTNYSLRAFTALVGLGANIAADAIYPSTFTDSQGNPLTGSQRYIIHFPAGHTPPANAFWSLTLYNYRQFFAFNTFNRYAIRSIDNLTYNADGSLYLFIQGDSPGPGKETNWLPSPRENFYLVMRIYWPKPETLDGRWKPPAVQRGG